MTCNPKCKEQEMCMDDTTNSGPVCRSLIPNSNNSLNCNTGSHFCHSSNNNAHKCDDPTYYLNENQWCVPTTALPKKCKKGTNWGKRGYAPCTDCKKCSGGEIKKTECTTTANTYCKPKSPRVPPTCKLDNGICELKTCVRNNQCGINYGSGKCENNNNQKCWFDSNCESGKCNGGTHVNKTCSELKNDWKNKKVSCNAGYELAVEGGGQNSKTLAPRPCVFTCNPQSQPVGPKPKGFCCGKNGKELNDCTKLDSSGCASKNRCQWQNNKCSTPQDPVDPTNGKGDLTTKENGGLTTRAKVSLIIIVFVILGVVGLLIYFALTAK